MGGAPSFRLRIVLGILASVVVLGAIPLADELPGKLVGADLRHGEHSRKLLGRRKPATRRPTGSPTTRRPTPAPTFKDFNDANSGRSDKGLFQVLVPGPENWPKVDRNGALDERACLSGPHVRKFDAAEFISLLGDQGRIVACPRHSCEEGRLLSDVFQSELFCKQRPGNMKHGVRETFRRCKARREYCVCRPRELQAQQESAASRRLLGRGSRRRMPQRRPEQAAWSLRRRSKAPTRAPTAPRDSCHKTIQCEGLRPMFHIKPSHLVSEEEFVHSRASRTLLAIGSGRRRRTTRSLTRSLTKRSPASPTDDNSDDDSSEDDNSEEEKPKKKASTKASTKAAPKKKKESSSDDDSSEDDNSEEEKPKKEASIRSPTKSPPRSPTRSPTKSPTRSPTKSPTRSPTTNRGPVSKFPLCVSEEVSASIQFKRNPKKHPTQKPLVSLLKEKRLQEMVAYYMLGKPKDFAPCSKKRCQCRNSHLACTFKKAKLSTAILKTMCGLHCKLERYHYMKMREFLRNVYNPGRSLLPKGKPAYCDFTSGSMTTSESLLMRNRCFHQMQLYGAEGAIRQSLECASMTMPDCQKQKPKDACHSICSQKPWVAVLVCAQPNLSDKCISALDTALEKKIVKVEHTKAQIAFKKPDVVLEAKVNRQRRDNGAEGVPALPVHLVHCKKPMQVEVGEHTVTLCSVCEENAPGIPAPLIAVGGKQQVMWICNTQKILGICSDLLKSLHINGTLEFETLGGVKRSWCDKIQVAHRGKAEMIEHLNKFQNPMSQLQSESITQVKLGKAVEFKNAGTKIGTITIMGWNSISCSLPRDQEREAMMFVQTGYNIQSCSVSSSFSENGKQTENDATCIVTKQAECAMRLSPLNFEECLKHTSALKVPLFKDFRGAVTKETGVGHRWFKSPTHCSEDLYRFLEMAEL